MMKLTKNTKTFLIIPVENVLQVDVECTRGSNVATALVRLNQQDLEMIEDNIDKIFKK